MVIGVTGGFGAGKSTLCRLWASWGMHFLEADAIVHDSYRPGQLGYAKIKGYFGDDFVDPVKGVLRDKLRAAVLKVPQKLWVLNKLIHPLIKNELGKKIARLKKTHGSNVMICIESLYLEKEDIGSLVDKTVLVERNPALIIPLRVDHWKLDDINRFIKLSPIYPKPDFVIMNNGSLDMLEKQAHEIFQKLS